MPCIPSGVDWARSITPARQPAAQRNVEANCTSWRGLSKISQPPSAVLGVPTISPFSARQLALPSVRAAPREDPWNVQSGTKFLFAPARGSSRNIAAIAADAHANRFHINVLLD